MKKGAIVLFQVVIVLIGIGVFGLMLWEPHLEGRNVHATPFEIYFKDPFLAYVYIASIPFFVALYQTFKVLGLAGRNAVFSQAAVRALRTIKYGAVAMIGFAMVGEIVMMLNDSDDRAGGVFMGLLVILTAIIIATAATKFERILQKGVDIKCETT